MVGVGTTNVGVVKCMRGVSICSHFAELIYTTCRNDFQHVGEFVQTACTAKSKYSKHKYVLAQKLQNWWGKEHVHFGTLKVRPNYGPAKIQEGSRPLFPPNTNATAVERFFLQTCRGARGSLSLQAKTCRGFLPCRPRLLDLWHNLTFCHKVSAVSSIQRPQNSSKQLIQYSL